ncbi:hypothetical protein [Marininema halotolerans]|uniref:Tetratricopeptide repeat-containing protein n=1 Tax=Marininema halotolerans TaxID=1155944 RepID=A0A1I6QKD5_9BACL|nr:hypothetical protein [Marininema halotolerans]SFS52901.1 hypothetical protein SAMN05444972_103207 [Marininema halotolerans]
MSSDYRQQLEEMYDSVVGEYSDRAVAVLEEVVRMADVHQDVEWSFYAREALVQSATYSGHGDKALVAFSWILAQIDKNPEYEDEFEMDHLLWVYKWIADSLLGFSHISKAQILAIVEDMDRRYRKQGLSLRAVENIRYKVACEFAEEENVQKHFSRWETLPKDGSQDCLACETNFVVNHYLFREKNLEQALLIARPLLEGEQSCHSVPGRTQSNLMLALLKAGRMDEADQMQRKSEGYASHNGDRIHSAGKHLQFLALTDQLSRALRIFEKMVAFAITSREERNRHMFFRGARLLFMKLMDQGHRTVKLRLATDFPVACDEQNQYPVPELVDWFTHEAERVAHLFDARNETVSYGEELIEDLALLKESYPLST